MKTVLLNQFNGGIVTDPRNPGEGLARMVKHFDVFTSPHKLTPYRSSEAVSNDTLKIGNFCVNADGELFGLGKVSGQNFARVFKSSDIPAGTFGETLNNASASGTVNYNVFVYYKKTNYIYGVRNGTHVWRYDPDGGDAWVDAHNDLTSYTNVAQGLVHSKDDILYIPYDNKIAKNNNGSWTNAALTLPSQYYITSISEFNNYLAIACAPLSGIGNSRVFLWNRDSSIATVDESIDWGEGVIKVLEELDGFLVGVSLVGNTTLFFKNRLSFKYYTGAGGAQPFPNLDFLSSSSGSNLTIAKQKTRGRIYFMCDFTIKGTQHMGVWSVGRKSVGGPFAVVFEYLLNNDTSVASHTPRSFILVGDYVYQSYVDGSANESMTKTNDVETFSGTSIFETTINPGMDAGDRIQKKQLVSVGVMYEPLPAAGQVVVKYKVDGGSYTTIFTEGTNDAIMTDPVTMDASGNQFTAGREYEFRIESTGGAEVTGLVYKYAVLTTNTSPS